jgi:carbon-monoxide dehydrogenase medium subunit
MLLPKFTLHSPETTDEAFNILSRHPESAILGGGTDLVVNMKKRTVVPQNVLSLGKIKGLAQIEKEQGIIRIGAGTTVAEIMQSKIFPSSMRTLIQSARNLGTPLIRNRATIGGNIMSARPAADLICSLLSLEADVELASSAGRRILSLPELIQGPGATNTKQGEILTAIILHIPPAKTGSDYQSLGIRRAQDINLVNVSTVLTLDGVEAVQKAGVVLGCVGPTHILSSNAAKVLLGQKMTAELVEEAAAASVHDCTPIDDFRSTAEYRRKMVQVLVKRSLKQAWKQAVNA